MVCSPSSFKFTVEFAPKNVSSSDELVGMEVFLIFPVGEGSVVSFNIATETLKGNDYLFATIFS